MPHNLFLHSEIIQSRQWNLEKDEVINKQLTYEFLDTIVAMLAGWAINSAMILVAASVFYANHVEVTELSMAQETLKPLLGGAASIVFAVALLCAGFSSSITAAMAGGSIFAGIFEEPFDIRDNHSRTGIIITLLGALVIILFLKDPFKGLIWSQIILSIQLPLTIFTSYFSYFFEEGNGKICKFYRRNHTALAHSHYSFRSEYNASYTDDFLILLCITSENARNFSRRIDMKKRE
jgi:manganese transport protein